MIRALIEDHLAKDAREAALDWLEKRADTYRVLLDLGLIHDSKDPPA